MQPRVAERHFLDLRKKYGNVLAVDLVNKVHGTIVLPFAYCRLHNGCIYLDFNSNVPYLKIDSYGNSFFIVEVFIKIGLHYFQLTFLF